VARLKRLASFASVRKRHLNVVGDGDILSELTVAECSHVCFAEVVACRQFLITEFSRENFLGRRNNFAPFLRQKQCRLELRFNLGNPFFKFRQLITNASDGIASAHPVPIDDLYYTRSEGAAWTPEGKAGCPIFGKWTPLAAGRLS